MRVAPADYTWVFQTLLKAGCGTFLEDLAAMDQFVVVPLLTEKIAESKRKKALPPGKCGSRLVPTEAVQKQKRRRARSAPPAHHQGEASISKMGRSVRSA